jgi:PII-like signaling protein
MSLPTEGKLLRIFIGEADHWHGKPNKMAKLLELSQDLPIIVEIVDAPEKIEAFIPDLEAMVGDGLITLERAEVLLYRPGRS